ncbi:lectin-like isoform X1 [Huso huso]|uniref:Lectin-like isoform X1 n=1 Tax=Huso huso TaxID=61971 RepID=A0ABR0ZPM7_HUSHU
MKITVLLMLAVAGFTATPGLAQIQMEKDAGLDVSALDTALGDLEDSDSTSDITDTDIEDEDGIELDITEDAVDEDRSNMAKASIRYRFFSTQKSFYDAEGNRFKWTDGSPWRFTNWMLGEPNNSGSDENCIEIFHNGEPWKMF